MDGSSGAMRVVESGKFCSNHHGFVLRLQSDYKTINLHWFVQQTEAHLKSLPSNQQGSATLTKPMLETFNVELPDSEELRNQIGEARKKLTLLKSEFASS
jgi:type I restriction enzyme M protein